VCLIVLAWRVHPDAALIVAANRDEFHARPAAPAGFWDDAPGILAGRDLEAGGTWMGVSRGGRFAAVTNYRGAREPRAAQSRGALVTEFLDSGELPGKYVANLKLADFSGFNLLASDGNELWWCSNRDRAPRRLEPGIYGLGNALLDDPEVDAVKTRFRHSIGTGLAIESLFQVVAGSRILNPQYGTRCSTVLVRDGRGLRYAERGFAADGAEGETLRFEFPLAG
jgi:uncharacterized protein with NRDE domain